MFFWLLMMSMCMLDSVFGGGSVVCLVGGVCCGVVGMVLFGVVVSGVMV